MDAVHVGGLGGTYGGNPVACAAALAAIDTMLERDLCAAARRIESVARPRLSALADRYPAIAEVRGRGAMLALELVAPSHPDAPSRPDSPSRPGPAGGSAGGPTPDPGLTAAVAKACHDAGLLLLTCGTYGNVIRLLPPLVIGDEHLDRGLTILAAAFAGATST